MTPQTIVADLLACDIDLRLTDDGSGVSVPAGSLTPEQRALVLANKPALIAYLIEAQRLTADLLRAAMRRCDAFQDSPAARQQMRQDVLDTPAHLQADLLEHFQAEERPLPAKVSAQPLKRATARPGRVAEPTAWRELAQAYHEHHFQCLACIAAGRGAMYGLRCGAGAALWVNYQSTVKTSN